MSLESSKLLRNAILENCLKLSEVPNYGATQDEIQKYIFSYVDEYENGGFVEPTKFYQLAYNKSIQMLNESK